MLRVALFTRVFAPARHCFTFPPPRALFFRASLFVLVLHFKKIDLTLDFHYNCLRLLCTCVCVHGAGTLARLAPETFDGKYSEKSDFFLFAVLYLEVLSPSIP